MKKMKSSLPFIKIMSASSIGTILEWYDFSLFAFLTPLLSKTFFPAENPLTSLMLTYAIFAIGFFVRPIGAAFFGHLGDKIGRKKTLIYSIILMATSTFLMGLLPTYQQVGLLAPVLLILLRVCQGLSVGGESTGAVLFILESDHFKYRGFIGGLIWFVVSIGMLLGSFAASIAIAYSHYQWSWRVPFLLGIFTGILGYFVRKRTPETTLFKNLIQSENIVKFPLKEGFKKHKIKLFRIAGIYTLSAMLTYLIFIFMPTYASQIVGLPLAQVSFISTIALSAVAIVVPLAGYISDLFGRKICLRASAFGIFILSYPLFYFITKGNIQHFIYAEICFVVLAGFFQGTINAAVTELAPTYVRFTLVAFGYNIAYSLFGGTAPLIASFLVKTTGYKASPGIYLMVGAFIALCATFKMRETHQLYLDKV